MHTGSHNDWLSTFSVGERRYVETTAEGYGDDMRQHVVPSTRRPPHMRDWKFTAAVFTAVAAKPIGSVRYLLCIERIE